MPFVGETKLLVSRGMTGATGNIYCGLADFEEMAFVLHTLRPDDLFLDVGANVGVYSVLAAGVAHSRVLSVEPSPPTFAHLGDNIRINNLGALVDAKNIALGGTPAVLKFSSGLDTINHVISGEESASNSVEVQVLPLDQVLNGQVPAVIKIDVEGFETEVIRGAPATLASPMLLAVLMELNGSGTRYGYDDQQLHKHMLELGFTVVAYDPWTRRLITQSGFGTNTIYVRSLAKLQERVQSANKVNVHGEMF